MRPSPSQGAPQGHDDPEARRRRSPSPPRRPRRGRRRTWRRATARRSPRRTTSRRGRGRPAPGAPPWTTRATPGPGAGRHLPRRRAARHGGRHAAHGQPRSARPRHACRLCHRGAACGRPDPDRGGPMPLSAAPGPGFKADRSATLREAPPPVGSFEVQAENCMGEGGLPRAHLAALGSVRGGGGLSGVGGGGHRGVRLRWSCPTSP